MAPASNHMDHWLRETRQLDLSHPKLRITAQKLTQSRQSLAARATAIHDFVRRMPFAAVASPGELRASDVLLRGRGDCQSKGMLFTAMCRAAGLPARMLFVVVRPRFLSGVMSTTPQTLTHAVGQVNLGGRWVSTDGYVLDPLMFALAKRTLREQSMDSGWGIVEEADGRWTGEAPCIQQFRACDVVQVAGVFADIDDFRRRAALRDGTPSTLGYALAARWVNWRVNRFRTEGRRAADAEARAARTLS